MLHDNTACFGDYTCSNLLQGHAKLTVIVEVVKNKMLNSQNGVRKGERNFVIDLE